MEFNEKLQELRKRKGLTQEELAEAREPYAVAVAFILLVLKCMMLFKYIKNV